MGLLDTTIPNLASKLITKFGTASLLITQKATGTYDTTTGAVATGSPLSQTVSGVIEEYADSIRFLGDRLQSSGVIEGDKKVTIAAKNLTFVPAVGDTIQVGSDGFSIINVASTWSGPAPATYTLHIRKI